MKEIANEIDFADSYIVSCEMLEGEDSTLKVSICAWNDEKIELTFSKTLQFTYEIGFYLAGLFEITENTPKYFEVINSECGVVSEGCPYKEYVIMDIDDDVVLHIIAERANALLK